jgi:hypothetical protein
LSDGSLTQAEQFVFMGRPPGRFMRMVADSSAAEDSQQVPKIPNKYGVAAQRRATMNCCAFSNMAERQRQIDDELTANCATT